MNLCGIGLTKILNLDPLFVEIVGVLASEEVPPAVWAVYYEGNIIAVYLTPDEAYARMLLVIDGIKLGQSPDPQTLVEAELIRDLALEKLSAPPARSPRFREDDQGFQP